MKLFFLIFISFLIGWTLHLLFNSNTNTKTVPLALSQVDCSSADEIYNREVEEKIVIKEVIKFVPQTKIVYRTKKTEAEVNASEQDLFLLYLGKKEFYNAMNYYQDAEEEKHPFYQTALFVYFEKIGKKNPTKAVEEMQYFIEVEPQSKTIVFQLAQLFQKREDYEQALNLIVDFSYIVDYNEKNSIHTKIKSISTTYIEKLKSANNFEDLIEFLINRINVGILNNFYSFELAKVYLKLKNYINSSEILETIQYNKVYKERAIEMLTFIKLKLEEKEEYPIQIPLIKDGLHFLVKAYAQNVPVVLMIDTGASITSIDYNKINHFKIEKKDALFHTAGGDVYETIFQADTFRVGKSSFKDFKISGSKFSGRNRDGLLGMNFLGKFKFKIDQQEAILFLGDKH